MFRSLPAAFALVLALLTIALREPVAGTTALRAVSSSSALHAKTSEAVVKPDDGSECGASLAQKSFAIGKITFPQQQRNGWTMVLRGVLTAIALVCVVLAYGGMSGSSASPLVSIEQPRRLATAFMRSLSIDAAATKATHEAASRKVALLNVRGLAHRVARLDEGEDGILDDDRDYAKIQGYLSRGEAYAQRQQFERADKLFKKGVHMAHDWLKDLKKDHTGPVEIDEASLLLSDAIVRYGSFLLERGQTAKAKHILTKADDALASRKDTNTMRIMLLTANAVRDAGKLDDATKGYADLLGMLEESSKQASKPEFAMLEGLAAEAHGDLARALLSQGKTDEALILLEKTLDTLTASRASSTRPLSMPLVSRLHGLLGLAELKQGNPAKAVTVLDTALAGLGELPAGLAGATTEVQEMLQTRAAAKAALGRAHSATEDLEVVRGLQEELLQTVNDGHNPGYAFGKGLVPDPRLWASSAKTTSIAAELKLKAGHANEALQLARKALHLLREVKQTDGRVPKGCNLATFAEVKDLIAKAKKERPAVAFLAAKSQEEKDEEEPEASHDEAIEEMAAQEDEPTPAEKSAAKSDKELLPKKEPAAKEQDTVVEAPAAKSEERMRL